MSAESKDLLTPALTTFAVVIAGAVQQVMNRKHGAKKDAGRMSDVADIKTDIRELRKTVTLRLDELDACVEAAQRDATEALHHVVGPDKKNGVRGNLEKVDERVAGLETRERERLEEERRVGLPDRRSHPDMIPRPI